MGHRGRPVPKRMTRINDLSLREGFEGAVSRIATRLRLTRLGPKRHPSAGERLPLGQGGRAADPVGLTIDEMALRVEMVVDTGMDGSEFL